ncbi:MAG: bacterial Ig-like domain-containing protein [Clostridiales bacterium]|nr:bacterial Ig-like domain-containing protein [Clostridiales bacterium]
MKKRLLLISVFIALCAAIFAFAACDTDPTPSDDPGNHVITVTAKYDSITVRDTDVAGYDYTYLFSIISDGKVVSVKAEYIDSTGVLPEGGDYNVVCTYGGQSATVKVHVVGTVYTIEVSAAEITILTSQVSSYDFKSLFTLKKDGEKQSITDDMVTSTVVATAGTYAYSVTFGGVTKTVIVHVIDDVIVVPSYTVKTLEESEVALYDYTLLFSLYVEGKAERVTLAMIDTSAVSSAHVGDTVSVGFSYVKDGKTYTSSVRVRVVEDLSYTLSSRDIVIYPHSENIELETLFEIRRGTEIIPVTNDMISGSVNYSQAGEYIITLNAFNQTVTAKVTVEAGVIVKASSDVIYIQKDTDKSLYPFSNDFTLVINGVKYFAIPEEFFEGLDEVDFEVEGDYPVTLRIPYNTKGIGVGRPPEFAYTECEVTYAVRETIGAAHAVDPIVTIIRGSVESFNVFSNVYATINGRKMALTADPNGANILYLYAKVISEPLDMNKTEVQHIEIEVYVYGADEDPIFVEYDVSIRDDVVITAHDTSVFTGATLFTTDLFEVTKNGVAIEVTAEMISGKVDTFNPGVYTVTLELGGVSATSSVTVFDRRLMGTYKTGMTTIPTSGDDDDYDDGEYGDWGDYGDYYYSAPLNASVEQSAASSILKDMIVADDGTMTVNGYTATLLGGIDENTLVIRFLNNDYTLYYLDGIIVLDPDNRIKLGFSDVKRPLVYFNEEVWTIDKSLVINYGANYVLSGTISGYSFDAFHIVKKDNSADMWYGLYVELAVKNASDTIYAVKWGELVFADGFNEAAGEKSSFTFGEDKYVFTMENAKVGKIDKSNEVSKYAGQNFTGTVDGKSARLEVSSASSYTFKIEGNTVFTFGLVEKNNTKNWYEDRETDTLFLYQFEEKKYSYTFKLNTQNNTFTVLERDKYYGLYESAGRYLYLDGYGTGVFKPDSASYETYLLRYTVNGDVLTVSYVRTKPNFAYGASSEFYIGEFLNTLKVKRFETNLLDGVLLVNSIITDGAIVNLSSYRFGAAIGSKTADGVKADIRNSISIITKDGEVSAADKASSSANGYIDLTKVSAQYAGYYRLSVTVSVGGEKVTSYYSIQIVKGTLEANNLFVGAYKGICFADYDFTIGANGQIELNASGAYYFGYAEANGDGLKFKAYSENGGAVAGEVKSIATNAIILTVSGSFNFTDYYVKSGHGSSRVVGISGTVLREITISGVGNIYVISSSKASTGEIVTLTSMSGGVENDSVVKIEKADGAVQYIKILKWGDTSEGISILSNYEE